MTFPLEETQTITAACCGESVIEAEDEILRAIRMQETVLYESTVFPFSIVIETVFPTS